MAQSENQVGNAATQRIWLDSARRLDTEPEDTNNLSDASHWRAVYQELLAGFRQIAVAESGAQRGARELQVDALRERFVFWDRRWRAILSGPDGSGNNGHK